VVQVDQIQFFQRLHQQVVVAVNLHIKHLPLVVEKQVVLVVEDQQVV
tara:strand:- start:363 stop:503 length:141 start_codon:yes stop_codon:yes gene_type:complete